MNKQEEMKKVALQIAIIKKLFGSKAVPGRFFKKIVNIVNQFSGEVSENTIKHRTFDLDAIVEVVQFDNDFMARYKVVDTQIKDLVTVDFIRGDKETVRQAYVDYQERAAGGGNAPQPKKRNPIKHSDSDKIITKIVKDTGCTQEEIEHLVSTEYYKLSPTRYQAHYGSEGPTFAFYDAAKNILASLTSP